jgi:hypothetical protein
VRLIYCGLLLAGLVAIQARAAVQQVVGGFRPFRHPPGRVAYSWDMFAIRMERCALSWAPPLAIEGASVSSWRDRSFSLEFDTVYNDARSYDAVARRGCEYRTAARTDATLVCLTSDGQIREHIDRCP